jgi:probable HAF family extracellular repeat protein
VEAAASFCSNRTLPCDARAETSLPVKSIFSARIALRYLLLLPLFLFAFRSHAQGPQYHAIDLGTLGGASSYPSAINQQGEIVGASEAVNPNFDAFSEISGTIKNLGTLGGSESIALGISDSGLIVGDSLTSTSAQHAFSVISLPLVDIDPFDSATSAATCVNDQGEIAGYYLMSGTDRAFSLVSGTDTDLGTLGGNSAAAYGINGSGVIVGVSSLTGNAVNHAFMYSSGTMTDLGVLDSGTFSEALGINDAGQVTGGSEVPFVSAEHAFLYTSGTMTDLGTPGPADAQSRGLAVNNYDQVAGSLVTNTSVDSAFLYTSGTMYDLNTLVSSTSGALTLNFASMGKVLNDWGQITANAAVGGFQHAFLLNPDVPFFYRSPNGTDTKFVQGMNYGLFTAITGTGTSFGSTVRLLDGTAVANRDIDVEIEDDSAAPVLPASGLASDIAQTAGFVGDLHVVQISYDPATVISDFIDPRNVQLDWYDSVAGKWISAAQASSAMTYTFVNAAYTPSADLHPGYYGIDLVNHVVWAVVQDDGLYAAAAGTTLAVKLVAGEGDTLESGSAALLAAGSPAISAGGTTSFVATLRPTSGPAHTSSAVVGYDAAGDGAVYVQTGQLDPVSNTLCTKVSDPAVGGTGTGLGAEVTVKANGTTVTAGQTTRIDRFDSSPFTANPTGIPLSTGAEFRSFDQYGFYDMGEVLLGALEGPGISSADSKALCLQSGTNLDILIQVGMGLGGLVRGDVRSFTVLTPLPFVGGQGRSVSPAAACAAALAKLSTGATVVTLSATGQTTITAYTGESGLPGLPPAAKIATIHEPVVNDYEIESFALTLSGGGVTPHDNSAIAYLSPITGISLPIRTGAQAPDTTGTATEGVFAKLSDPVLNENNGIAFIASLLTSGSNGVPKDTSQGIWSNADGTLREIVREGDGASGITGGSYTGFEQIVLPSTNEPLFEATFSGGHPKKGTGVWVATENNGILPLVFTGQILKFHGETKTVSAIKVFEQPKTSLGITRAFDPATSNTVFQVTFTDHTWGIYEAAFD